MPPRMFDSSNNMEYSNSVTQLRQSADIILNNGTPPISSAQSNAAGSVTVALLSKVYNIPSNKGSTSLTQSVFSTKQNYYSPGDLTTFQTKYGLPKQAALNIGGYATTDVRHHNKYVHTFRILPSTY